MLTSHANPGHHVPHILQCGSRSSLLFRVAEDAFGCCSRVHHVRIAFSDRHSRHMSALFGRSGRLSALHLQTSARIWHIACEPRASRTPSQRSRAHAFVTVTAWPTSRTGKPQDTCYDGTGSALLYSGFCDQVAIKTCSRRAPGATARDDQKKIGPLPLRQLAAIPECGWLFERS